MRRRDFLAASAAAPFLGLPGLLRGEESPAAWPKDLSEHRIASFETFGSNDRYTRSLGPNARLGPHGTGYRRRFRVVTTDQRAVGMGLCWPDDDVIKPFVGTKVSDLFDPAVGTDPSADPLDIVLHDLAGVILQKPVYQILGSKGPTSIDIYSGAIYMDDLMPEDNPKGIEAVLSACQMDYDAGYRAFKLKIGRGNMWMPRDEGDRRDIEVTRAVREKFPDCKVMVDANDGYSVDGFLKYVTAVADCDLYVIEEPFDEHREGLVRLREHMADVGCNAMIADGEFREDHADKRGSWGDYTQRHVDRFFDLADDGLIDVCVFDLSSLGFTQWRKAMPRFADAGIKTAPHLWGGTPKPFYCAHLAAGIGNVLIVEGIPGVGQQLDYSGFRIADGQIHVPDTPGFGIARTEGDGIGPSL